MNPLGVFRPSAMASIGHRSVFPLKINMGQRNNAIQDSRHVGLPHPAGAGCTGRGSGPNPARETK